MNYLFNRLQEMMEQAKALWNVGSDEKPDHTWWGAQIVDISLSDRENSLIKGVVRYKKIGMYAAINSNAKILNRNNGKLLRELDSVDEPCNAKIYWSFNEEELHRCFVTHTPWKHIKRFVKPCRDKPCIKKAILNNCLALLDVDAQRRQCYCK